MLVPADATAAQAGSVPAPVAQPRDARGARQPQLSAAPELLHWQLARSSSPNQRRPGRQVRGDPPAGSWGADHPWGFSYRQMLSLGDNSWSEDAVISCQHKHPVPKRRYGLTACSQPKAECKSKPSPSSLFWECHCKKNPKLIGKEGGSMHACTSGE